MKRLLIALAVLLVFVAVNAFAVCPVVTEGGVQKITCDQVYTGDVTFDGAVSIPGGIVDPTVVTQTTSSETYYVRTTGSDSNDCLTVGTACLTPQAGIDLVPIVINHVTGVDIGPGTFDSFRIVGRLVNEQFTVTGAMATSTLATGTATGTTTSGGTDYIEDTGQSWTVDDLKGRFVNIATYTYLIRSNTAIRANLVGIHSAALTGAYTIQDPATIIESVAAWTTGIVISNVQALAYPEFTVTQMKLQNLTSMGVNVDGVPFVRLQTLQIVSPQYWGVAVYRSFGVQNFSNIYVSGATFGGYLFTDVGKMTADGLMSDGGGAAGWAGITLTRVGLAEAITVAVDSQGGDTSSHGIYMTSGTASIKRAIVDSSAGDGVYMNGGAIVSKAYQGVGLLGTGNAGYGVRVNSMCSLEFSSPTAITGTSGDATIDNGTTTLTWATNFASNGDVVANTSDFCRIERKD